MFWRFLVGMEPTEPFQLILISVTDPRSQMNKINRIPTDLGLNTVS